MNPLLHRATGVFPPHLATLVAFALIAWGPATVPLPGADDSASAPRRLQSTHEIRDAATWARLAARPASSPTARTEVVKFLLDRDTDRTLWFVDTERWSFHYAFARDRLGSLLRPVADHDVFNRREYRTVDRRFEMGSIVHYLDAGLWTMELIGGDTLEGEKIVRLFEEVRAALWIGDQLKFRPLSDLHEASIARVRDRLPLVTADEVLAGVVCQPLKTGTAFGTLRLVRGPLDLATVRPDHVLVLEKLPDEIPVCAAVISAEMQAPLGHIALLCASRGTPNMALRGALEDPQIARLEGSLVALTVDPQGYTLRAATLAEAERDWAKRRPKAPRLPRLERDRYELAPVAEVRLRDASWAGAKAAQLGEISRIKPPIVTPGGFVVPLGHYLNHLRDAGLEAAIDSLVTDPTLQSQPTARIKRLEELRRAIEAATIEPSLVAEVHARMRALAPSSKWILRSSTNAEDLAGFTGAGLYRSVKVKPGATEADLARAMREVWASVWLQGAWEEREWYRIDHRAVAMALLVQPFVDGARANGVAITANPFAEFRPGVLINAQTLGGSVTGATGEEIPEQRLVYTFNEELEEELLSQSSRLPPGELLLGPREVRALTDVLQQLHKHFLPRWGGGANAVDVEFLIAGEDRHVVILQARPFTVTYGEGQRMED
jgi:hypothetical protein